MAIHIHDIEQSIKLLKRTRKILNSIETDTKVAEIHRLSTEIDFFLNRIEIHWDGIETVNNENKMFVINNNKC